MTVETGECLGEFDTLQVPGSRALDYIYDHGLQRLPMFERPLAIKIQKVAASLQSDFGASVCRVRLVGSNGVCGHGAHDTKFY